VYVSNHLHNDKNISIFAPDFSYIGHTITNLAKFQAAYFERKYSRNLEKSLINKSCHKREINFYHIGNSPHNLEVLENFVKSRSKQNILILHDTNLTDLVKFAVRKNGLQSLEKILKNQSKTLIENILKEENYNLDATTKCSFFVNSIIGANLSDTKIIIHNSKNLETTENLRDGALSLLELPIGYHFMKPLVLNFPNLIPLIVIGGSSHDGNFPEKIKLIIQGISSKSEFRVIILGAKDRHSFANLNDMPNVSVLESVSNENWQIVLSRANIVMRISVGRNGESSGFLRDGLLRSKFVLGDEDSQVLRNFSNYTFLDQDCDIKKISQLISERLENSYPKSIEQISKRNTEAERNSLDSYFRYFNELVVNL